MPRAVNTEFWEEICPDGQRVVLDVDEVNVRLGIKVDSEGIVILERWIRLLRDDITESCVEISRQSVHIFDFP